MLRGSLPRPTGRLTRAGTIEPLPDIALGGLQAAVLAYRAELVRFLAARGVAADEAEDVLQDLYVKVSTTRIAPVGEPRAYLYRMTANMLADRRRTAARRAMRERLWSQVEPGAQEQADDQPTAEQALSAREDYALVSQALADLPERTVEVLRRYRIDGQPQKTIASELGISLSAVEKHLQKAYRAVIATQARLAADHAGPDGSEVR
jgi:RNA polymerase sigma-70 factor (ECF subfamily)